MKNYAIIFALMLLSLSCKKEIVSSDPWITKLNCSQAVAPAAKTGTSYLAQNIYVGYEGGNGMPFEGQPGVMSTGVTGLTANLHGGTLATGKGNLVYTIAGTPSAPGTATFNITFCGQSCSFSLEVK